MSVKLASINELKKGSFVIVNGDPCRVVSIEKSKTGKHGHAKARIVAVGVFDNVKRSIVQPTDAKIEVPIIDKRTGMIVSKLPDGYQIMDMETNEIFEMPAPEDSEIASKLESGVQVEYWDTMGKKKIIRIKGS